MPAVDPDDQAWLELLQELDEPVEPPAAPPIHSILRLVSGNPGMVHIDHDAAVAALRMIQESRERRRARGDGDVDVPRGFDEPAAERRLAELAVRLTDAFGGECASWHHQDSACHGGVTIPAEYSRCRTKRTRIALPVDVSVSRFGDLAAYGASAGWNEVPYIHPDTADRIGEALAAAGYLLVPAHILALPYDGPNGWVFGDVETTWHTRFFDYL
jgi:hypothetical protein